MRTLEILLALVLLIRIVLPLLRRVRWIEWLSLAALGVMMLHLIFEGFRWQMIPLYMITLWLSSISIWRISRPGSPAVDSPERKLVFTVVGVIILGLALILPILLPIPRTPEPTGSYDVGTIKITLIDESRKELYALEAGRPRTFNVQFWYPAILEPGAKPAPWLDHMEVMGPALAAKLNLPSFFLDHVKYARAYAVADAALSSTESQYPILLFSHGWGGFKAQNTFQVEQLASHGYIVAAPDHTFGAIAAVLPDGSVALNNPEALPIRGDLSEENFMSTVQVLGNQWSGDLSYILDSLENLGAHGPGGQLANHVDFNRVGVLGHSTGGGAAIQFCASDERCQLALGMDPYMDPVSDQILNRGLKQPYLAMFSESWAKENDRNNNVFDNFFNNILADRYRFYIKETEHYDFTDMPAFSPLAPYLGLKGTLEGEQVSKIINAYTLAFVGRYLKGETGAILDQPAGEYPEMIYLP